MRRAACLAVVAVLAGCAAPRPQSDPFAVFQKADNGPDGDQFTRVFSSEVDTPSYQLPEKPRSFALVIGIEKYQSLPEAQFAERDAASVREHLLALGVPPRNMLYLTGKDAGKAALNKYLDSWLPLNVTEGSRLFVYFSGHGAPAAESGQAYLIPWDGDLEFLAQTAYPLKAFYDKLAGLKAKEVIVAMDACFSGAGGRSVLAKGLRPLVAKVDTEVAGASSLVVLTASDADEITGSDDKQGHGFFTYHLLQALNERKGRLSVLNAYEALLPRVKDAARRQNRDQTPQLMPKARDGREAIRFDR